MKPRRVALRLPRASRGFSMIELLIGTGISLVILSAVTAAYIGTSSIGRANARVSEIQSIGQQAMDVLRRDIINAGFSGLTGDPDQFAPPTGVVVGNSCANGFAFNLRQAVWAANDANPFNGSCIPAANYATGDVLVVRRLGLAPGGALQATRLYLRSAYQAGVFFQGSAPPASFTFVPAVDYAVDTTLYFISPFTTAANESPAVPALYRVRLIDGPAMTAPELVATGVEDLQVQFEVLDATTGTTRLLDPGVAPIDVNSVTTTASGWDSVVAVHVFLLVRARSAEAGYAPGNRTYTLGSKNVAVNDGIQRQVLSSVFSLRNR